jgi:hypothetical protein
MGPQKEVKSRANNYATLSVAFITKKTHHADVSTDYFDPAKLLG